MAGPSIGFQTGVDNRCPHKQREKTRRVLVVCHDSNYIRHDATHLRSTTGAWVGKVDDALAAFFVALPVRLFSPASFIASSFGTTSSSFVEKSPSTKVLDERLWRVPDKNGQELVPGTIEHSNLQVILREQAERACECATERSE